MDEFPRGYLQIIGQGTNNIINSHSKAKCELAPVA